jgi:hypothetical protein
VAEATGEVAAGEEKDPAKMTGVVDHGGFF